MDTLHFRASDRHIETFKSSSLHNTDYSLLLHVSATGYGHLQGATNFIDVCSLYCKYVNGKNVNFYNLHMKFVIPEDGHILWSKHIAAVDKSVQRILGTNLCGKSRPVQYILVVRTSVMVGSM